MQAPVPARSWWLNGVPWGPELERPLAAPSRPSLPFPCLLAHWVFLSLTLGEIWDWGFLFLSLCTAWQVNSLFIFRSPDSATVQAGEFWFPTQYLSVIKSTTTDLEKSNVLKSKETKCKPHPCGKGLWAKGEPLCVAPGRSTNNNTFGAKFWESHA